MTTWREGIGCVACDTPLASDQRYCLMCGTRRAGAQPPALAALAEHAAPLTARDPLPAAAAAGDGTAMALPAPRSAAALTAVVLGMGVLIGAAVGPAAVGSPDAAQRRVILVSAAQPVAASPAPVAPAATAAPSLDAPSGDLGGATDALGTLGGGASTAASGADTSSGGTSPATTPTDTTPTATTPTATTTPAAGDGTKTLAGTVVHVNRPAASFTIADAHGGLVAVHAATLPQLGDPISSDGRLLANGTYEVTDATASGRPVSRALLHGVVTAVDPQAGTYVVSARGVSLLVTVPGWTPPAAPTPTTTTPAPPPPPATTPAPVVPPPPAATTPVDPGTTTPTTPVDPASTTPTTPVDPASTTPTTPTSPADPPGAAAPTLPVVGHAVTVTVSLVAAAEQGTTTTPARLDQTTRVDGRLAKAPLPLEGVVRTVDAKTRIVTLTADDLGAGSATVAIAAPKAFRLDYILPDTIVAVTARLGQDGTLTMTGSSSDAGSDGADTDALLQGDQKQAAKK